MLDAAKSFRDIYAQESRNRQDVLERYADQLATLCSILGEYPSIRPENESQNAIDLAHFLQAKLNGFKVTLIDNFFYLFFFNVFDVYP